MANSFNGIPRQAINSSGGLEYVLIADWNDVKITVADGVADIKLADDSVIDISNNPFKVYKPAKESSNITETYTGVVATQQGSNEQIATLVFAKSEVSKRNEIQVLATSETVIIGVDINGYSQLMGARRGADLTSSVGGTGTAGGDLNGYTLTLRALDPELMPSVSDSLMTIIKA